MYLFARTLGLQVVFCHLAFSQVVSPVAEKCGPSSASVVCINRYGAVLPYHFYRSPNGTAEDPYGLTSVPADPSFAQVATADFLIFDRSRGLDILGPNPTYKHVFNVSQAIHEAPVWVPKLNKLFLSQLAPPPGYLPQLVVDLNVSPPTLSEYLSDPPVYAPNGGTFHNGLIYWCVSGGNMSIGGVESRPGIATLDTTTNKAVTILNNYFGYYFNDCDDLTIDRSGNIWFTDPFYSWFQAIDDTAPQMATGTYHFNPSTGAVRIVEDSLAQPNGIAISPDGKTMYISDTGAATGIYSPLLPSQGFVFNSTGPRSIYAYDIHHSGSISNKRAFYRALHGGPDGVKVAKNGYVVTAAGTGVDVLDETGTLLVRVQTSYAVQNFAWVGEEMKELWLVGFGGISKVTWGLEGQELK
ncbi:hypothetical protein FGG08_003979 [Glutinoglossum americanum]|uniref:SMP-30/Gluconolactonase/LRE-like region domain-containing protein n=1 Tax=Glutinoglossum americanum TaxID=1670608 RepID=A0A9P8KXK1_9PEZI|nr:hypothetical protein FGG08_003979 [Glutinoglossum americanum]